MEQIGNLIASAVGAPVQAPPRPARPTPHFSLKVPADAPRVEVPADATPAMSPEEMQQAEEQRRVAELRKDNIRLIREAMNRAVREIDDKRRNLYNLADPVVYEQHSNFVVWVANNVVLANQNRKFVIDDNNKDVLRFMLYYFNGCPLAEKVFPDKKYKLHKHLLLMGKAGSGKTLLMQIFSEYLRLTRNPNAFHNLSMTQMVNYYTLHNNLDRYTYNEEENLGFRCQPVNICLNDLGVQTTTFYGMDTKLLADEFLHARNEVWTNYHKMAHITTNLTIPQLKEKFQDGFGRLLDRFKTYNVIELKGGSRR